MASGFNLAAHLPFICAICGQHACPKSDSGVDDEEQEKDARFQKNP